MTLLEIDLARLKLLKAIRQASLALPSDHFWKALPKDADDLKAIDNSIIQHEASLRRGGALR